MESDTEAPTLDDAMSYITRIKVHYSGNPDVYNRFLKFLKEYRENQEMDTRGSIERLTHLFIGHPALIQGFNAFLPRGYRIERGTEENPDTFRVTTPSGITTQTLQRPVGTSDLVLSNDPEHPANLIPELCAAFYKLGWVTGTGGGVSIKASQHIFIAPSGVQKELIKPKEMFVLSADTPKYPASERVYLRKPPNLKPSDCTPLFLAAFERGAGCCIHTHSQWCVLITLLVEKLHGRDACFEISNIEQIKGIPKGRGKAGRLGFHDTLRVPIIENTAFEEDLTGALEAAMEAYPDTYAVLVRRHGIYVWGDDVAKAKTQCESLDYIFQLAVRMHELGLTWT